MTRTPRLPSPPRHSAAARILVFCLALAESLLVPGAAYAQTVHPNATWWKTMGEPERWDFIYGFLDCGPQLRTGLNVRQYDDFISDHVDSSRNSVPQLIRLAPHMIRKVPPMPGGEVWKERHGFNDGDLWGDHIDEGRAWVEGYLSCEGRPVELRRVNRYVKLMLIYYSKPERHHDKLANVLEPLLPPRGAGNPR